MKQIIIALLLVNTYSIFGMEKDYNNNDHEKDMPYDHNVTHSQSSSTSSPLSTSNASDHANMETEDTNDANDNDIDMKISSPTQLTSENLVLYVDRVLHIIAPYRPIVDSAGRYYNYRTPEETRNLINDTSMIPGSPQYKLYKQRTEHIFRYTHKRVSDALYDYFDQHYAEYLTQIRTPYSLEELCNIHEGLTKNNVRATPDPYKQIKRAYDVLKSVAETQNWREDITLHPCLFLPR